MPPNVDPREANPEGTDDSGDLNTLPLSRETLTVEVKRRDRKVSVQIVNRESEVSIDEELESRDVVISRVAIGRFVEVAPAPREEGETMVVPVMEERLVRRLFLKEEIHIRRTHSTSRHVENVVLRKQDAVIIREPYWPASETAPDFLGRIQSTK